jgi:hypothetical protein
MSLQVSTAAQGAIEECLDEINDFMATLEHYPPTALAVAMSVHLESVLRAMLECDLCTRQQVRELVQKLESEVLEQEDQEERDVLGSL